MISGVPRRARRESIGISLTRLRLRPTSHGVLSRVSLGFTQTHEGLRAPRPAPGLVLDLALFRPLRGRNKKGLRLLDKQFPGQTAQKKWASEREWDR